MRSTRRRNWLLATVLLIGGWLVIGGLFAPRPASAVVIDQTMDENRSDFEQGGFARTGLFRRPEVPEDSPLGVVTLTRVGQLNPFAQAAFNLPLELVSHGAVAIGNRIYVIGGRTLDGSDLSDALGVVWSAAVDATATDDKGLLTGLQLDGDWRQEPSLPAATVNTLLDSTTTDTYNMAVAAWDNPNPTGNDYIYVLGGLSGEDTESGAKRDSSIVSVWIGTVDPTTGAITTWRTSDSAEAQNPSANNQAALRIPAPDWSGAYNDSSNDPVDQLGASDASAIVHTEDGVPYLYLFGGAFDVFSVAEGYSKLSVVARIGSDGLLYQRGTTENTPNNLGWSKLADIPTAGNGLAGSKLVSATSVTTEATAFYFIGGQTSDNTYPADLFRAFVENDGTLTWNNGGFPLEASIIGHAAAEVNKNIYVIGGRTISGDTPDLPRAQAEVAVAEDDLGLFDLNAFICASNPDTPGCPLPPDFFLNNTTVTEPLPRARANHAAVTLNLNGTGFVYVLGGARGIAGSDENASNSVYLFRVSDAADENQPFAPNGYYSSRILEIGVGGAQIEEIAWEAVMPGESRGSMDIRMEFRTTNTASCEPAVFDGVAWQQLDGDKGSGFASKNYLPDNTVNSVNLEEDFGAFLNARCFQYRAQLISSSDQRETPQLQRVGLRIYSPNSPDLRVLDITPVWQKDANDEDLVGFLTDLDIRIINLYEAEPANTLDANVERSGPQFFFADGWIFGPGYGAAPANIEATLNASVPLQDSGLNNIPPTFTADDFAFQAGAGILKDSLPAGETYEPTGWCGPNLEQCTTPVVLNDLFTESGEYTVCVAVDSYVSEADWGTYGVRENDRNGNPEAGYVRETLPGAEDNNALCQTFDVIRAPVITLNLPQPPNDVIPEGTTRDFTLQLDKAATQNVNVGFALEGEAVRGTDYRILNEQGQAIVGNSLSVTAGQTSATYRIEAINDGAGNAGDARFETVLMTLSEDPTGLNYALDTPDSGTFTIQDPGVPPLPPAALPVVDVATVTGQNAQFDVQRDRTDRILPVTFAVSGTATRGTDYVLRDLATGKTIEGTTFVLPDGAGSLRIEVVPQPSAAGKNATITLQANAERYTLGANQIIFEFAPGSGQIEEPPVVPPPPTEPEGDPRVFLPVVFKN